MVDDIGPKHRLAAGLEDLDVTRAGLGAERTRREISLAGGLVALEEQLASLTGQIEQSGYRTRQLQDQFDAYKRATDARLKALESGPAPIAPAGQSAPLDTSADGLEYLTELEQA